MNPKPETVSHTYRIAGKPQFADLIDILQENFRAEDFVKEIYVSPDYTESDDFFRLHIETELTKGE